jgi:pantothenate kinase
LDLYVTSFRFIAQAAREKAVEVSVIECVAKLAAMESDTTEQIVQLRQRVHDIVQRLTSNVGSSSSYIHLQREANKLLHIPTMQLRGGNLLSEDEIDDMVRTIEENLIRLVQIGP